MIYRYLYQNTIQENAIHQLFCNMAEKKKPLYAFRAELTSEKTLNNTPPTKGILKLKSNKIVFQPDGVKHTWDVPKYTYADTLMEAITSYNQNLQMIKDWLLLQAMEITNEILPTPEYLNIQHCDTIDLNLLQYLQAKVTPAWLPHRSLLLAHTVDHHSHVIDLYYISPDNNTQPPDLRILAYVSDTDYQQLIADTSEGAVLQTDYQQCFQILSQAKNDQMQPYQQNHFLTTLEFCQKFLDIPVVNNTAFSTIPEDSE